jgi:tRNA pseudouridine32 synthase/23S rRNA pseudouridine746 synthase
MPTKLFIYFSIVKQIELRQDSQMKNKIYKIKVESNHPGSACDILALEAGLSKMRIKKAMNRGAVWLEQGGSKKRRIRRATTHVHPGDTLYLYYNESIIQLQEPTPHCIRDYRRYSIWYKPVGLMTQGSPFGDHCTLSRQVQNFFKPTRNVFIVHRIDREASGLVMVAHDRLAAAALSQLLRQREVQKYYQVNVRGDFSQYQDAIGSIELALDDKAAKTCFQFLHYDARKDQSKVRVWIETGRRHQIRRHFDLIGYPVMGDPRYGSSNKNQIGLQLVAYALHFKCPFDGKSVSIEFDPDVKRPFE